VQAVAGPAFELCGIVAAEEMARARRYEGAALQHIAAKIGPRGEDYDAKFNIVSERVFEFKPR